MHTRCQSPARNVEKMQYNRNNNTESERVELFQLQGNVPLLAFRSFENAKSNTSALNQVITRPRLIMLNPERELTK